MLTPVEELRALYDETRLAAKKAGNRLRSLYTTGKLKPEVHQMIAAHNSYLDWSLQQLKYALNEFHDYEQPQDAVLTDADLAEAEEASVRA